MLSWDYCEREREGVYERVSERGKKINQTPTPLKLVTVL